MVVPLSGWWLVFYGRLRLCWVVGRLYFAVRCYFAVGVEFGDWCWLLFWFVVIVWWLLFVFGIACFGGLVACLLGYCWNVVVLIVLWLMPLHFHCLLEFYILVCIG